MAQLTHIIEDALQEVSNFYRNRLQKLKNELKTWQYMATDKPYLITGERSEAKRKSLISRLKQAKTITNINRWRLIKRCAALFNKVYEHNADAFGDLSVPENRISDIQNILGEIRAIMLTHAKEQRANQRSSYRKNKLERICREVDALYAYCLKH